MGATSEAFTPTKPTKPTRTPSGVVTMRVRCSMAPSVASSLKCAARASSAASVSEKWMLLATMGGAPPPAFAADSDSASASGP